MVKVSMEIRSGAAHFDVGVQAESIQRAVSFVKERYSKANVRVKFPIEPESFFVEDPSARTRIVGLELPARVPEFLRALPRLDGTTTSNQENRWNHLRLRASG
jgi:hypothetical protein